MTPKPVIEAEFAEPWVERWKPPLLLVTCPSCGLRTERRPGAWSQRINGPSLFQMNCSPKLARDMTDDDCWRTFEAQIRLAVVALPA